MRLPSRCVEGVAQHRPVEREEHAGGDQEHDLVERPRNRQHAEYDERAERTRDAFLAREQTNGSDRDVRPVT